MYAKKRMLEKERYLYRFLICQINLLLTFITHDNQANLVYVMLDNED